MVETAVRIVRNNCGIRVKRCCASCAKKEYTYTGKRFCTVDGKRVEALNVCQQWQMSEGLKNPGRRRGVVRDIVTKEVIIR
jgi:hypothetical protein